MDKIICLGKNYQDHIKEMGDAPPERPVLFIKPPSAMIEIKDDLSVPLPFHRGPIHHEVEIVFKLYKKNIIGVGVGLDLTLRDLQRKLKDAGHPWEISKTFRNAAIVSPIKAIRDFSDWQDTPFSLKVNGEIKQESKISNAIMGANEIIHYVDEFFPLNDGDLIFTGTPSGVGPINPGDILELSFGPIHHRIKVHNHER